MEVRPIDEVIELRHSDIPPEDTQIYVTANGTLPANSSINTLEQAFLASCGAAPLPPDLGKRVSFDRASLLVWSTDNGSIYYLSVGTDPTTKVGLRQVHLPDQANVELSTVPSYSRLQADTSGGLYISDANGLYSVSLTDPSTAATLTKVGPSGAMSPDGHWLSYQSTDFLHILNLQTGVDMPIANSYGSGFVWSRTNELAYWTNANAGTYSLNTLKPGDPADARTYPSTSGAYSYSEIVWSSTGPLVTKSPIDFPFLSEVQLGCSSCFGLSLNDPTTDSDRAVLDATVGQVSRVAASAPDAIFVWATNCGGLYATLCSSALVRVNLIDATSTVVARYSKPIPVAASTDGHHLALGAADGIYVKDLP